MLLLCFVCAHVGAVQEEMRIALSYSGVLIVFMVILQLTISPSPENAYGLVVCCVFICADVINISVGFVFRGGSERDI